MANSDASKGKPGQQSREIIRRRIVTRAMKKRLSEIGVSLSKTSIEKKDE